MELGIPTRITGYAYPVTRGVQRDRNLKFLQTPRAQHSDNLETHSQSGPHQNSESFKFHSSGQKFASTVGNLHPLP
eukprot:3379510-Rhodomonas_salina.1